ncbi:hypothetical protein [Limnofasciculus baicalensis]|uniref:Tetratricopeptide repeat protein n=1 Tax=Limnofasciculus baicalensis BBK-W-15 TaxID=2699891 RepID=A0AAE3KSH0_9CYAN|nr:hypothetical protein [Limnofasciculus baicalensis]MCP2729467.1 hypothetical protein [Limnofasciculus baicalensis BBK-W-15]
MDIGEFQDAIYRVSELHKQRDYNLALKLVQELLAHYPYSVDLLVKYAKLIQLSDNESDEFPPLMVE